MRDRIEQWLSVIAFLAAGSAAIIILWDVFCKCR